MTVGPGERTRRRIVEAAERLFAERGLAAVSLREIAAAAGQRNTSAAAYHFGSRAGLIDAIFELRMEPINRRRLEMLAAHRGREPGLRHLVEALVYPLAESLGTREHPTWYLRFIEETFRDPDTGPFDLGGRAVTEGLRAVIDGMTTQLADLPDVVRAERIALAVELVVHALARREARAQSARLDPHASTALVAANLVDAALAVLRAPMSSATRDELTAAPRSA